MRSSVPLVNSGSKRPRKGNYDMAVGRIVNVPANLLL